MERFEFCICVVEKTDGSDNVRFKYTIRKFDEYANALEYAKKIKNDISRVRGHANGTSERKHAYPTYFNAV